jgi:hypothetical protein
MPRPTVMTSEMINLLREAFLIGATDEEACFSAGICRDTLYSYQKSNGEFSDQKKQWKLNPILKARKTIFRNLQNVSTAKWFLERKARSEFNTRTKVIPDSILEKLKGLIRVG